MPHKAPAQAYAWTHIWPHAFFPLVWALLACAACPAAAQESYATRADARQLADDVAREQQLPEEWVRSALGQARFIARIQQLMAPPPANASGQSPPPDWNAYRSRFVEPQRIRAGLRFWQTHAQTLQRATQQYGVPEHIIVGIIGVETLYGRRMGNWRVLDALSTLALDFPPAHPRAAARADYFRQELAQFLRWSHRNGIRPEVPHGSYAGAMGPGQFMPGSWAKWGVDFDGDGHANLFSSMADTIGAVANYLAGHGWKKGLPTHFAVDIAEGQRPQVETLLALGLRPQLDAARIQAAGVKLPGAARDIPEMALVRFARPGAEALHIAATSNFYAVTRYNQSSFYALAVIELGEAVRAARQAATITR